MRQYKVVNEATGTIIHPGPLQYEAALHVLMIVRDKRCAAGGRPVDHSPEAIVEMRAIWAWDEYAQKCHWF
jgi:hypothetical protein